MKAHAVNIHTHTHRLYFWLVEGRKKNAQPSAQEIERKILSFVTRALSVAKSHFALNKKIRNPAGMAKRIYSALLESRYLEYPRRERSLFRQ